MNPQESSWALLQREKASFLFTNHRKGLFMIREVQHGIPAEEIGSHLLIPRMPAQVCKFNKKIKNVAVFLSEAINSD